MTGIFLIPTYWTGLSLRHVWIVQISGCLSCVLKYEMNIYRIQYTYIYTYSEI